MDPQFCYTVLLDPQWIPSGSPVDPQWIPSKNSILWDFTMKVSGKQAGQECTFISTLLTFCQALLGLFLWLMSVEGAAAAGWGGYHQQQQEYQHLDHHHYHHSGGGGAAQHQPALLAAALTAAVVYFGVVN